MKKIILPFTSNSLSASLIEFGCYIARLSHASLTGICLTVNDDVTADPASHSQLHFSENNTGTLLQTKPVKMDAAQCTHFFMEGCKRYNVAADVLVRGGGVLKNIAPVEELVRESRFADLLLLDPSICFHAQPGPVPSAFTKEMLAAAECPVIVAPAVFDTVDELVFCYDGEHSSVYAIKQFTYLFPELGRKKVTVLQVCENKQTISEKEKIHIWLNGYYSHIEFKMLSGDAGDELLQYFLLRKNLFAVMGAYGRSMISTFFKKSSADLVLRVVDLPLFIAHNKQ